MRILCLTPWWPRDDEDPFGSFVRDQAAALRAAGADVRVGVIRLRRPGAPRAALAAAARGAGDPPVAVVLAPWLPHRRFYRETLLSWESALGRAVARQGAWARDALLLVHTQDLAVPGHRLARRLELPFAVVAHGAEPESPRYESEARRRAYRTALEAAERVVAVGPGLAAHLRGEAPGADVRAVLNGFLEPLVARVSAAPRAEEPEPRIASVSNLARGKGVDLTLAVLARRRERGLPVPRYDVVGDGTERAALEDLVRREGLGDRVRFHGALPRSRALGVVAGARAFVLPSRPEACGVAYLEAMGLGVAPVAVRGEGPSAFVEDGVTGLLCDPTAEDVSEALARVLDEPGVAEAMGAAARRASADLGWSAAAKRLLSTLPERRAARRSAPWLGLYNEPTPYVTALLDRVEETGRVRLRRAWAATDGSQSWGGDAPFRGDDVLAGPLRVARTCGALLRRRYRGVLSGGWNGRAATVCVLASAWLGRSPLVVAFDSHESASRGLRAALRRAYLRVLDRRVRAWLPAGSPQARHLAASVAPRAPVVLERMTVDGDALEAERARLGPEAGRAWRREHGVPDDAALLLYVGRIAPEKGVGDLLRAAGVLAVQGVRLRVALLGGGTLPAEASHAALEGLVVAPGRVPWRSLAGAYLAADVFVLPSRAEPWGLVVNEALLLGCPVVVTDAVGAAEDLVERPGSGLVVPAGDPAALAAAVRRVIDAGGRRSRYAANAADAMRGWTLSGAARTLRGVLAGRGPRAEA